VSGRGSPEESPVLSSQPTVVLLGLCILSGFLKNVSDVYPPRHCSGQKNCGSQSTCSVEHPGHGVGSMGVLWLGSEQRC